MHADRFGTLCLVHELRPKRLHVLRHAKSSWGDAALDDHGRPLNARGRRAADRIAEHIRDQAVEPEVVLCSSARRTRETYERIEHALVDAEVQFEPELYHASQAVLLGRLQGLPADVECAMLVGHNPGLQDLVLTLAQPGYWRQRVYEAFPTGALASLLFVVFGWSEIGPSTGELEGYVVPRELLGER